MHLKQNRTSDKFFEHDVRRTLKRYPELKRSASMQRNTLLEGSFPITAADGYVADTIALRIIYRSTFPFSYPVVYETGARFSSEHGEMHINGDGSLCLNSPQQERIDCYTGMDTLLFVESVLVPNLAWRLCVLDRIPFDREEYGHSMIGIIESYQQLLKLENPGDIYRFITMFMGNNLPERNKDCFCRSVRKYKVCHGQLESNLYKIGNDMLQAHLPMIKSLIK